MLAYIPFLRDIDFEAFFIRMNEMDFQGQKKAELYYRIILILSLVIAIIFSYSQQKLSYGVYVIGVGLALAMLVNKLL